MRGREREEEREKGRDDDDGEQAREGLDRRNLTPTFFSPPPPTTASARASATKQSGTTVHTKNPEQQEQQRTETSFLSLRDALPLRLGGRGSGSGRGRRRTGGGNGGGGGGGDGDDGADPFAPRLKTEVDAPLRPEDIRVGDVIDVFGRRITVADADAATRAWLLSRAAGDERKSPSTDSSSSPSDSSSDSSSPQFARLPGDAIPVPEGDYEVAMRAAAAGKGFFERGSKEEGGKERERGEKMGASFLKLRPPPRQKTQTQNSQTLKQTNKNSPRARQGPQPRRDLWERSGGAPLGQAAGPGRRYV